MKINDDSNAKSNKTSCESSNTESITSNCGLH